MRRHLSPYSLLFALGMQTSLANEVDKRIYERGTPEYEAAAEPLRQAATTHFHFNQARFKDVLLLLAQDAGINFISPATDPYKEPLLVDVDAETSAFGLLEELACRHKLTLSFHGKFWTMSEKMNVLPPQESKAVPLDREGPRVYLLNGKEITPEWEVLRERNRDPSNESP